MSTQCLHFTNYFENSLFIMSSLDRLLFIKAHFADSQLLSNIHLSPKWLKSTLLFLVCGYTNENKYIVCKLHLGA